MTSNHFPQELIDIVIDNLHDDIPTLKSCSLAAQTFVTSARAHIFNKIEIKPPSNSSFPNTCQKLHKLLTSSPHIARLVEELCIVLVGSETSFEYDSDGEYLGKRHIVWVMAGRTLPLVLPLLDLKRISLIENAPVDWNDDGEYSMNWNKMGRQLKSALANVFSSPRLEAVHLRGIVVESPRQLLSLFSEATALKELSLSRLYFTQRWDQREEWPESQPWHPQLRSLLVSETQSAYFCRHLVNSRIDLAHVTSLTLVTNSIDSRQKIMEANSGGAEHLRLWFMQFDSTRLQDFLTPNLRSVHFFTGSMFTLLGAIFKACPDDSRLEYITVEGYVRLGTPIPLELDAAIDSAVAHLRSLKMIEIKWIRTAGFDTFAEWEIKKAVPSLVRRGMLRVGKAQWPEDDAHHGWE